VAYKPMMTHEERHWRREDAIAAMRAGKSPDELARELGLSPERVHIWRRSAGIPCERKATARGTTDAGYATIALLLNTDLPENQVAKRVGLTRERVRQIAGKLKAAGVKFRSRARNTRPARQDFPLDAG